MSRQRMNNTSNLEYGYYNLCQKISIISTLGAFDSINLHIYVRISVLKLQELTGI